MCSLRLALSITRIALIVVEFQAAFPTCLAEIKFYSTL
jgi:hypothetical protein